MTTIPAEPWIQEELKKPLKWYFQVALNLKPAKYLICRRIEAPENLKELQEEELWRTHERLSKKFQEIFQKIKSGELELKELEVKRPNFLDLKVELVERMLRHCNFCRWNCKVNRVEGRKHGTCQLESQSRVSSYFHHRGEELPIRGIMGSGTIFFTSCNMRCIFCLHPDMYVITPEGPKKIQELFMKAGEEVQYGDGYVRFPQKLYTYTYNGKKVKVSKIFRHDYVGKMIVIKPFYAPPLVVTPNHELVVYDEKKKRVVKKRAGEVTMNDKLLIPKIIREAGKNVYIDVESILNNVVQKLKFSVNIQPEKHMEVIHLTGYGFSSTFIAKRTGYHPAYIRNLIAKIRKNELKSRERRNSIVCEDGYIRLKTEKRPGIPARIKLDEEVAELLGYYCSEGHVTKAKDRPSSYRLVISFGLDEEGLANRTKRLLEKKFNVKARIIKRKTTITVEVGKTSLALLFKSLCGGNAHEKRVPYHIFSAPDNIIKAFIEAVAVGDGSITSGYLSINTVSREFAHGLFGLYLLLGHLPSYNIYKPPPEKIIGSRKVKQSTLYYVKVRLSRMKNMSWKEAKHVRYKLMDNYIIVPIYSISTIQYKGPVYNLEVSDESHVYTANYIAVGNCQNGDISHDKDNGVVFTPEMLAVAMWQLRMEGCHNINLVGGEPTIHLHTIVRAISLLKFFRNPKDLPYVMRVKSDYLFNYSLRWSRASYDGEFNTPILWNSNMFMSVETMKILRELVDIWLPDFKFGNNRCAIRLSKTPWYFETVSRNHKLIYDWGESIVIRHLVMPGHVECCTKPVLRWIAENMPGTPVNIMDQYHPDYACNPLDPRYDPRYSDMARYPTGEEITEAYRYAKSLGLNFEAITFEKSVYRLRP